MLQFCALVFSTYLISATFSTPIIDSENVGTVQMTGKTVVVTGHTLYPYVVYVKMYYKKNGRRLNSYCTGVIIGENTILTAAHCLHEKVDLRVVVHAGIVDIKWEEAVGQKLQMNDFLIHKDYEEKCTVGPNKCCYDVNDIAIVWTREKFRFGLKVEAATLNKDLAKPAGTKGYILGWGHNEKGEEPSMLQRGLVKVVGQDECRRFSSKLRIPDTAMCVRPVAKKTGPSGGDSGGPFAKDGVVYGIASITLYSTPCHSYTMDIYTYVAEYSKWIDINSALGAPKDRIRGPSIKAAFAKQRLH